MAKFKLKDFILPTKLDNTDNNQQYGNADFETTDYIFLDSKKEVEQMPQEELLIGATDYAIANGAYISFNDSHFDLSFQTTDVTLRSTNNNHNIDTVDRYGALNYDSYKEDTNCICPAMHLDIDKILQARKKYPNFGKIEEVEYKNNGNVYHTIEFGEYPKTIAHHSDYMEELYKSSPSFFKLTGKRYTSAEFKKITEFKYDDEKYVRVYENPLNKDDTVYSDGCTYNRADDIEYVWIKVEPLKWIIRNWKHLPKELNPDGDGTAEYIDVRTEEGILSGISFNNCKSSDNNRQFWQNSQIRAYLNGYDNRLEIISKGNGNSAFATTDNFDFSGSGFINEAFSREIELKSVEEKEVLEKDQKQERINPFGVKIDERPLSVKEQMKFYIENGMSFMLHGPSGVGKTRRVQEIDPNCIGITLRDGILPEEITGKTAFNEQNNTSSWIEPTWYTKLCKICNDDPEHYHVLFIDELTNTRAPEQSLAYNLILDHTIEIGRGELPKNCVVIAAGNSPEESSSANILSEPLFRRFVAHIELKPNLKEWLEWGSELKPDETPKIHPLVAAFVAANAEKVFYTKYDPDKPPKFAIDPRGWEQISDVIYSNQGILREKMIADKIGAENARSFISFAKKIMITVEDIMADLYMKNEIPKNADERFALTCSLRRANETQVEKVRKFIKRELGNEYTAIFDSMWVGEDDERAHLIEQIEEEARRREEEARKKRAEEAQKKREEENEPKRVEQKVYKKIVKIGNRKANINLQKRVYKITIDEFWASKDELAIQTPTKEQADTLLKIFDKMGKTWCNGVSYLEDKNWDIHKENTCYSNNGKCLSREWSDKNCCTTYQFDEVDMARYLEKLKKQQQNSEHQPLKRGYKITVDEFWASKEKLAIQTSTKEQSDLLRKVFDKMGKTWYNGDSYLQWETWNYFSDKIIPCFSNDGTTIDKSLQKKYTIYQFDEVDIEKYLDKNKYKITIDEFWASKEKLAIQTPTKKQSDTLLKIFDKMGKTWCNGASYLKDENDWATYMKKTCYANNGSYQSKEWGDKNCYTTFQFNEVDMEKYLNKPKPKYKITIDEFWDAKFEIAIQPFTKEQTNILCKIFDKMGKKMWNGNSYESSYLNASYFTEKNLCFSNKRSFYEVRHFIKNATPIYKFDEVDIEKYLDNKNEAEI